MLADGERPVLSLASCFSVSVPAVSQHLAVLRACGLVEERREGRQRVYYLTPDPLREVAEWMAIYQRFWTDRLGALGAFLARQAGHTPPKPRKKGRRS